MVDLTNKLLYRTRILTKRQKGGFMEELIIDLKLNESENNFNLELHEKILFELFKMGLTLEQIGVLKGEI